MKLFSCSFFSSHDCFGTPHNFYNGPSLTRQKMSDLFLESRLVVYDTARTASKFFTVRFSILFKEKNPETVPGFPFFLCI